MAKSRAIGLMVGLAALGAGAPALADVKDGVDAWSRGDYAAAIAEWQGPAQAGDPDALFNLAQAYRLGRGVPANNARAEDYYLQAAQRGHVRAADTYGLLLFQDGRREQALPFVEDAAKRGDPRSQYLLGIAYFNGDIVAKDWVRAYALLTLANQQSLPQAAPALAQMDQHIPLADRQQAAALAVQMERDASAARERELAAFDLADVQPGAAEVTSGPIASATPRVPQPIASAPVPPSTVSPEVAAARAAVREASLATGTESPADAGADYARPAAAPPRQVAAAPAPTPAPAPAPARTQPPAPAPQAAATSSGPWKVQLGAFGVAGNAERLWNQLAGRPELAGKNRLLVPSGRLTKLLAGGYATRAEAEAACSRLKQAGQACLVTQ